ncbi:deoxyribonuclease II family protein [Candidatus Haliotispira prima]|uniref:Deoxyribonuclease II family protein n=1 Tax=Candidatus Haliotispira prima TaxID=3034016 RepID=A0ABY8MIC0_9SPIO|nr:deoxyribonuclease II family protein [Candidatus Haliotispira prima]
MNPKNELNQDVDWWFIYKLPELADPKKKMGYQYLYFDESYQNIKISEHTLDTENGALYSTLNSIYKSQNKDQGFITYNDEKLDYKLDDGTKGHCKGILVFNKKDNSAMLLSHSVPRFPWQGELTLPESAKIFGQTLIAISLESYDLANEIANQMLHQQNPGVFPGNSYLPDNISEDEPLAKLFNQSHIQESPNPSIIKLKSKLGKDFQLIAKNRHWKKDFWIDLVSPALKVDLDVESWRRGKAPVSKMSGISEEVEDIIQVDLSKIGYSEYQWKYTKDHSKWAVANKASNDQEAWVCVGDINRMVSQEKRSGGTLCFREPTLWKALRSLIEELKIEN